MIRLTKRSFDVKQQSLTHSVNEHMHKLMMISRHYNTNQRKTTQALTMNNCQHEMKIMYKIK
jgi:hypothetical protein